VVWAVHFLLYQQYPSDLSDPPSLAGADLIRWLTILAAIASATCFIGALNMGRVADSKTLVLERGLFPAHKAGDS
jgi:hypothetical protein